VMTAMQRTTDPSGADLPPGASRVAVGEDSAGADGPTAARSPAATTVQADIHDARGVLFERSVIGEAGPVDMPDLTIGW
jgi:hypothetical protein